MRGASLLVAIGLVVLASTHLLPAQARSSSRPFRDLNHNGHLDPYEDASLSPEARVEDLLGRMTLEEKVGTLLHGNLPAVDSPFGASTKAYDFAALIPLIDVRKITSFITRLQVTPAKFAEMNNEVQRLAERSRLGIPVTISTDPRNHFEVLVGATNAANGFSQWPDPIGFAAIGDPRLVRQFGDTVRQEYRAVGIHMALSPQADLATEPRWPRISGTFGSDPAQVSRLTAAYVEGFQGSSNGVTSRGVATVAKHWIGYGAAPGGFDAHNYYGRRLELTPRQFALHAAAFRGPLAAQTAAVMPTYAIVAGRMDNGELLREVGAGFNPQLMNGMLRGRLNYKGLVLSDWGIINDCPLECLAPTEANPQTPMSIGMPWGVERSTMSDRAALALNAGLDQFGGLDHPEPLLAAVRTGKASPQTVTDAARRVLWLKFKLGLFDNPYVDPSHAAQLVGNPNFQAAADAAQRNSQVILENRARLLPLAPHKGVRLWLYGVDAKAARNLGFNVVASPDQADVALVRASTPSERLHPNYFFASMQKEGRLDFRDGDAAFEAFKRASARVPTVFAVDLDRPAILTDISKKATALVGLFGASDAALLDVVTGRARAKGRLPFNLPRSMQAVINQDPAMPDDDIDPLYRRGYGLYVAAAPRPKQR